MGVFDTKVETRTPAQVIADRMRASARRISSMVASEYDLNYDLWWKGEVNPIEIAEALGTDAYPLLLASSTTLAVSGKADRLKSIPDAFSYVVNPDGSVTVTAVPQPEPDPIPDSLTGGSS